MKFRQASRTLFLSSLVVGWSLLLTGCAGLSLDQLVESLFWDIGQPNTDVRYMDLRLSVNGAGRGSSVNVYFNNSSDSTLDFTVTTQAAPRVRIEPTTRGDARVRMSRTPSGEDRLTITLRGRNSEAVGVRVTALSVGAMGEPGDQLFITSPRHRTVFPVWIEPSEGQWKRDVDLGIVGVHAALLRNGQ